MATRNIPFEQYAEETTGSGFADISIADKISLREAFDGIHSRHPASFHGLVTMLLFPNYFMCASWLNVSIFIFLFSYSRWKHVRGVAHLLALSAPPSSYFFCGNLSFAYYDDFSLCHFPILCIHALDL